jgi:putative oxidoreductase
MTFLSTSQWLLILRVAVGLMLAAHGVIRMYADTVSGFGEFLSSNGLPMGIVIAWGITVFEVIGEITLAAGYFRKWIAAVFIVELLVGILLVHAPIGWFVVEYTSGGMEYSVLLILCLLTIASIGSKKFF